MPYLTLPLSPTETQPGLQGETPKCFISLMSCHGCAYVANLAGNTKQGLRFDPDGCCCWFSSLCFNINISFFGQDNEVPLRKHSDHSCLIISYHNGLPRKEIVTKCEVLMTVMLCHNKKPNRKTTSSMAHFQINSSAGKNSPFCMFQAFLILLSLSCTISGGNIQAFVSQLS